VAADVAIERCRNGSFGASVSADDHVARRAGNRWSSAPHDAEAARQLLNRRVAFFGGVFFLLSLAFYVRNVAMISVTERTWPPFGHPALLIHLAAILLAGLQWLLCRSGRRSRAAVDLIDAGGLIGSMALYCALVFAEAIAREHAIAVHSAGAEILLVALILLALVLTHAIIVPATVRRALALSLACGALGTLTAYGLTAQVFPAEMLRAKPWLPLAEATYLGMWAGLCVAVAIIAARVIHGLKQRVWDANKVGQYTLEERIGEGGMGLVYLARHALLRRATAVKLLHPDRTGETALRRFEQEARITSTLTHPSTITIFDFGRTPEGVFYYAMEYLDGVTLADLIAHDGAQKPARVVQLLRQVCGSLDEAHSAGLIHRDIKPANLMLCVRGLMPDQVKVLDFGLVKERGQHAGPGLSAAGTLLGTPAYLAPEAILDSTTVDARTDLYALGAVAYELLVSQPVFDGSTVVEVSLHHLQSEPVPPSLRSAEPIPLGLEQLVLRCLAKNPAERPGSASEMMAMLDRLGDVGSWTIDDARCWWRDRGPRVRQEARQRRRLESTPGPRTVAIDLVQRR
jgi:serine/threonine-protein kinase